MKKEKEGEFPLKRYLLLIMFLSMLLSTSLVAAELPASGALDDVLLDQGIHFIRPESKYVDATTAKPHYLSVDTVSFVACLGDGEEPKGYIVCLDNNNFKEIELVSWNEEELCYAGGISLSDFSCQNALIEVEYGLDSENLKLSEEIVINTFSSVADSLINAQYTDGGWREPLDTAFAVLGLSYFEEIFSYEVDQALTWLKQNRNDDEKCWPKAPCNFRLTSKILALLDESNINDSNRIVNDGRNLLEERHLFYEQEDDWYVTIDDIATTTVLSLVSIGQDIIDENFSVPEEGAKNYTFDAIMDDKLIIISDENIRATIYDQNNLSIYVYQGDNLSYTIPGACWSLNMRGEPCSTATTAYALVTNISEDHKEQGKEYTKTQLHKGVVSQYYGDEDDPVQSALYVRAHYDEDLLYDPEAPLEDQEGTYIYDVLQWVLFQQHNEGYWGDTFDVDEDDDDYDQLFTSALTDQLMNTAFVSYSLLDVGFNRTSEPIMDAQKWVAENEDSINVTSGAALGAAMFIVRHHAYPLLYTSPSIIVIDESNVEIDLINPTPFNLKDLSFTLSDGIKDYVSVEEKSSVGAYTFRKLPFHKTLGTSETKYGFLSIGNADHEITRIPIVVRNVPTINITAPTQVTMFGKQVSVPLGIVRSNHAFTCSMGWETPGLEPQASFTVAGNSYSLPVHFSVAKTEEELYKGTIICSHGTYSYEFPINLYVKRFVDKPLTVFPSSFLLNDTRQTFTFTLKNNLDIDLPVDISVDRFQTEIAVPQGVYLSPGEVSNVTFATSFDPLLNHSGSASLSFSAVNTTESITLVIEVMAKEADTTSLIRLFVILLFILLIFAGVAYVIYRYRDELLVYLNKIPIFQSKQEIKKTKDSLRDLRTEERDRAILNTYQIMHFQQSSDQEIRQRLVNHFSKAEIRRALDKEGIILETLDDEEPELA